MTTLPEATIDLRGERIGAASDRIVAQASQCGYTVVAVAPGTFRLARSKRPTWTIVFCVLCFPIGLLFLLIKQTETAMITVFEDRTGTKARIVGQIDARLAQAVAYGGAPTGPPPRPTSAPAGSPPSPGVVPPQPRVATPPPKAYVATPPPIANPQAFAPNPPMVPVARVFAPTPPVVPSQPAPNPPFGRAGVSPGSGAPSSPGAAVSIALPDGRVVPVVGPILIGRNPDRQGVPGAETLQLADPSLSKTHLRIEPSGADVLVTDLDSTNGTELIINSVITRCPARQPCVAPTGATIRAGYVAIVVRGRP